MKIKIKISRKPVEYLKAIKYLEKRVESIQKQKEEANTLLAKTDWLIGCLKGLFSCRCFSYEVEFGVTIVLITFSIFNF